MIGGLRDIISNILNSNQIKLKNYKSFGIDDKFCSYNGSYEGIKKEYKLSEKFLSQKILSYLK